MLAKFLKVPAAETLEEVLLSHRDMTHDSYDRFPLLMEQVDGLYAWTTNVAADVMNDRIQPLTEFLISMPGNLYLAKDTARSGEDSLWLAVGDPPDAILRCVKGLQCRGLFHTFKVGEEFSQVVAIQLSSCQT